MKIELNRLKFGYDIVVVGGGAAGCSFLGSLADNKYSTLMIDSRSFPRFKACSGILVNNSKGFFSGASLPPEVLSKPSAIDIVYQDWASNSEKHVKKNFINTCRKELDNWLFSKVLDKNMSILENTKLVDFFYTHDKNLIVLLLEHNGKTTSVVTKYLVGCDGALSIVRKKIFSKNIRYYVAIQELISGFKLDRAYFIFDDEITDFYGWLIPKGDCVEIGAAVSPFKAKEKFDLFKKKVSEKFGITGDGKIESAIVLRPSSLDEIFLGKDSIFLCGEAAALISPSSAEGISYALLSGKYCAEAFNSNLKSKMESYKEKCKPLLKRLNKKFIKSRKMGNPEDRKLIFGG
ncbi:MAG TPA: hypothetical protein HA254_02920 [Candidatus Diapherotrites archaeon]|uniref:FAD-binding domain-containing protein n=1 Tax=Candidatus Iainarchaeum sp. TaxID=3101447 RepID=A0A7J4IVQ0_9ARCH|nr:hypothetical protein [Candidatus Diapherotrites archaeon]